MSKTIERPRRIASKAPWFLRPFIISILWKCGECPNRLKCLDKLLDGNLSHFIPDQCPDMFILRGMSKCENKITGAFPSMNRLLPNYIAKFLRENCRDCRSLDYCAMGALIEVKGYSIQDLPENFASLKQTLSLKVRECSRCPVLAECVGSKMRSKKLSAGKLLLNYLRMRKDCILG